MRCSIGMKYCYKVTPIDMISENGSNIYSVI